MSSTTDKEFLIRVKADIEKAVKDMRRMTGEIEKQGKGGKKTKKSLDGLGQGYHRLAAAAGAYISVAAAIKALKIADGYNILQRRIATATRETNDYVAISQELYEITQKNGVALRDTVAIFQRMAISGKALGATNDDILVVTNTVQQLGVISGATYEQMKFGLMQFGQALSTGTVRAEEINSVLENIPELAVRIEKALGILPGQLKNAVNQGKVLSKDVFEALLRIAPKIAAEFAQIPEDLARSVVRFDNSLAAALSRFDKSIGATKAAIGLLNKLSERMDASELDRLWRSRAIAVAAYQDAVHDGLKDDQQLILRHIDELDEAIKKLEVPKNIAFFAGVNKLEQDIKNTVAALKQFDEGSIVYERLSVKLKGLQKQHDALIKSLRGEGEKPTADDDQAIDPKVEKRISRMVKLLEFQAATWGKTAQQVALYRIELELGDKAATEFGKTVLANARAAAESIAAREAQAAATERLTQAEIDFMDATRDYNASQREMLATVLDSVDPFSAYYREMEKLEQLAEQFPEHADKIKQAMQALNADLPEEGPMASLGITTEKMTEFAIQAARNIQSSFADFLFDPFSDGMDGMLTGFVRTLHRMVSEMLAQAALMAFFKSMAGGDSSSIWMKMAGAVMHDGGIVGQGGTSRMVSPLMFANAPRYHSGGIVGLKPLEMPAILQKGEEVLPRSDPRHAGNGGGGNQPLNVTIVDDRESVDQYMATPAAGQHTVMHIKRNAQVIRGMLS